MSTHNTNSTEDGSGWIKIKPKPRRVKHNSASGPSNRRPHNLKHNQLQSEEERRTSELRSVSSIHEEYISLRKQWDVSSPCRAALQKIVSSFDFSTVSASQDKNGEGGGAGGGGDGRKRMKISKAVCLGIGSFDPPDGGWEPKRKAYTQLLAFLTIVSELERRLSELESGPEHPAEGYGSDSKSPPTEEGEEIMHQEKRQSQKIECIFQEPVFTPHDKEFLSSLSSKYRVVDTPTGCDLVDSETFLFGVHLYRPIYAMALRDGPPAVFVGTGWDVWDSVSLSSEPSDDLNALREMEHSYTKFAFPQDPNIVTAFSSTSIYFRREAILHSSVHVENEALKEAEHQQSAESLEQDLLVNKLKSTIIGS